MLHSGKAFTYNSKEKHTSILGFNKHINTSDLLSSIVHEAEHIKLAIVQEYNITDNETPAYLLGYIVMKMWELVIYRSIKKELDSLLPPGSTTFYRLPQFKGTLMDSIKQQQAMDGKFKAIKKIWVRRKIVEEFCETAEDEEYGSLNSMNSPEDDLLGSKLDYEEERVARIPLFGINKLTNMQDLSSDLCHSMLAYASMATSYNTLNTVVDALEVGRQVLAKRNLTNTGFLNRTLKKPFGSKFKTPVEEDSSLYTGSKNAAFSRSIVR